MRLGLFGAGGWALEALQACPETELIGVWGRRPIVVPGAQGVTPS